MLLRVLYGNSLADWAEMNRKGLLPGELPYGIEHLRSADIRLAQLEQPAWLGRPPWAKISRFAERRYGAPVLQPLLASRRLRGVSACLAVLDPQGLAYARLRALHIPPRSRVPLIVVNCFLAQRALETDARGLRRLRGQLKGVDMIIYWSRNQRTILTDTLGVPDERLFFVPFGVETEFYKPGANREDFVLAVGQDAGRDYRTLLEAVEGLDVEVKIACSKVMLRDFHIPANVSLLGWVAHQHYRELLQRAALVVTCSNPDYSYPTGQTVLLHSMACQAPTIVTDTIPMSDYAEDGVNTLLVAPRDPGAVRAAIELLLADKRLRDTIGEGGRRSVEQRFNARAMWGTIGQEIERRFGLSEVLHR